MLNHYTIYTMPNCPHCVAAKALFEREGFQFTEIKEFTKDELIDRVGPVRTLPQILIENGNGTFHVGGYSDLLDFRAGRNLDLRKLS